MSEFSINMLGAQNAILQQEALDDPNQTELLSHYPYHIYTIGRRPRVGLVPDSLVFTENTLKGQFTIQRQNSFDHHNFIVPHCFGTSDITVESTYPYSDFSFIKKDGTRVMRGKSANLVGQLGPMYHELLDLEVLYVGQSYGDGGSRDAKERIKSHSTLQNIYSHAITSSPDQDIWLILWHFEEVLLMSFDGRGFNSDLHKEADQKHTENVLKTGVTEQQRINFAEAAMIRYFQPAYNEKFKGTFPSPAHSTYSQCYEIDLNSVHVELQTPHLLTRLWSASAAPNYYHFIHYELHSQEERRGMFDFSTD